MQVTTPAMDLDTEFVFNIKTLKGPKILHRILYQYLELKVIKFDVERNGKSILSNLAVVMTDEKDMLTHIFTNIDIHRRFNGVSDPVDKKDQLIVLEEDSVTGTYNITTQSGMKNNSPRNNGNSDNNAKIDTHGNNEDNGNNENNGNDRNNSNNDNTERKEENDDLNDNRRLANGDRPD